jgi:CBS domain-containing protein
MRRILVNEIMTDGPARCEATDTLTDAARAMLEQDCGCIPIVEGNRVVGVVTDRDIAVRAVAAGRDGTTPLGEIMSHPVATISVEATVDECRKLMEDNQVRRIVVLDNQGELAGMVSLADVALCEPPDKTGAVVRDISRPGDIHVL